MKDSHILILRRCRDLTYQWTFLESSGLRDARESSHPGIKPVSRIACSYHLSHSGKPRDTKATAKYLALAFPTSYSGSGPSSEEKYWCLRAKFCFLWCVSIFSLRNSFSPFYNKMSCPSWVGCYVIHKALRLDLLNTQYQVDRIFRDVVHAIPEGTMVWYKQRAH